MGEKPGDVELSSVKQDPSSQKAEVEHKPHRRSRRWCACLACCGCCGVLLVIIALVLIILALTVFKPKKPKLHVDHVTVEDFDANVELNTPSLSLNITLGLVVSVKNPNKAAFRFYNSTASVFYRDDEVGSVPISAGYLGAGGTTQISSSLTLFADRLISDKRFYADLIADSLSFSTTAHIGGKVNFLKIVKHHVDTSTVCNVTIIPSHMKKGMQNLECTYDINL